MIEKMMTYTFLLCVVVLVPPHQLILYDKSGRDVSGVVGPLEEGNELVLVCEVRGGTAFLKYFILEFIRS